LKHIKTYKLFESNKSNLKNEVLDIYQDFIDHFNLSQVENNKNWYSDRRIAFGVTTDVRFGSGVKVSLSSGNYNRGLVYEGYHKGFEGLPSDISIELQKAHKRYLEHIDFKDCIIGSYYKYQSGGFEIVYYTDPSFVFEGKEFNPEHLYSEGAYVRELPKIKSYVVCKNSHENIFDFYSNDGQIGGMYCLWGGKSPMYYFNPISIISGNDCDRYGFCIANTPTEQWISKQWSDMCKKYDIPASDKKWSMSRQQGQEGDPTVYEFMECLVENQDDYKNYKKLPKVNNDR